MAYFFRLIFTVMLFTGTLARAELVTEYSAEYSGAGTSPYFPSKAEAAKWAVDHATSPDVQCPNNTNNSVHTHKLLSIQPDPDVNFSTTITIQQYQWGNPPGSGCRALTPSTSQGSGYFNKRVVDYVACTPPQTRVDGVCVSPPPEECKSPFGQVVSSSTAWIAMSSSSAIWRCMNGCSVFPSWSGKDPTTGSYRAQGPWTSSGASCVTADAGSGPISGDGSSDNYKPQPSGGQSPGDVAGPEGTGCVPNVPGVPAGFAACPGGPDAAENSECKAGYMLGSVNGVPVCVRAENGTSHGSGSKPSDKPTAGGDGGPGGEGGEGGRDNTATSTKCEDGKCTTTTTITTKGPDGAVTESKEVVEETQEQYCTKNPRVAMCIQSSITGDCGQAYVCEGDAIQCAIARDQLKRSCELFEPNAASARYDTEVAKTGTLFNTLPGASSVDVGPNGFNQTDLLGGGACIANRTVSVMGSSLTLPFSMVCPDLTMLGNVLLACSFLLGARIVTRG